MKLLIVNYHYIRKKKPKNGIYPLSINEFSEQVNLLSKKYKFISQSKIIEVVKGGTKKTDNYCLLTFDDGLKEQMEVFDFLTKHSIPAIFYPTTNCLENHEVLDVHKLHYIRSQVDDNHLFDMLNDEFKIDFFKFDFHMLKSLYEYDTILAQKVKYFFNYVLKDKERKVFIDNLFIDLVGDEKKFAKNLYMDSSDLLKLASSDMLGTHAKSHLPLATLTYDGIFNEISHSINYLENIVGKNTIKSISYPYGTKEAVSQNVADISKNLGLDFAVTMFKGINSVDNLEPFLLKRVDTKDIFGGTYEEK